MFFYNDTSPKRPNFSNDEHKQSSNTIASSRMTSGQGATVPFLKPYLNSMDLDFYLDLHQIAHIHTYQSPKYGRCFHKDP